MVPKEEYSRSQTRLKEAAARVAQLGIELRSANASLEQARRDIRAWEAKAERTDRLQAETLALRRAAQAKKAREATKKAREAAEKARQAAKKAASEPWKDPANWKRLKEGMREANVIKLLGQPTGRTTYKSLNSVHLSYSYHYVDLTNNSRRVTGWSGPSGK